MSDDPTSLTARRHRRDMGIRVRVRGARFTVDATALRAKMERLDAAQAELRAAWADLPVGLRERLGPVTITVGWPDEE